jgi:hypothetical protein
LRAATHSEIFTVTVAAVTIANGDDNIGIYTPLFAAKSGWQLVRDGVGLRDHDGCVVHRWTLDGQAPNAGRTDTPLWASGGAVHADRPGRTHPCATLVP